MHTQRRNHGNILIVTMIAIAVVSALAGVSFTMTSANRNLAARDLAMHQAQALAEGSLEISFAQWKRYMDNNLDYSNSLAPTADKLTFINANPPCDHPALQSRFADFTFNRNAYKVVPIGFQDPANPTTSPLIELGGTTEVPNVGQTTGSAAFTTKTNIYRYKATVEITANPPGGPVSVALSRYFEVNWSPLVQNAIFYEDTMDIFPGAQMDIIGDVHANGTIYGGHDYLNFWQKVTAVADFNNKYNPGDARSSGTPAPPNWKGTGGQLGQLSTQVSRQEVLGANPGQIVGTDPSNVNVKGGIHEIIQMPVNSGSDPDGLKTRRFFNQAGAPPDKSKFAGVTILINPNAAAGSRVTASYTPNPNSNTAPVGIALSKLNTDIASYVAASGSSIKDFREFSTTNPTITLHNVDVGNISKVIGDADPYSKISGNGVLLYVADTTVAALPASDVTTAIRLRNGATLSGDLTIASQNPIYVQGDYNTGLAPLSNTAVASDIPKVADALGGTGGSQSKYDNFTQGPGYTRKAAMIATDAINILSNGWLDANSTLGSTSARQAVPTTMNTAFLTGNVPSLAGEYSGGVENLPRFHEKWSGIPFTVYGSFIELFPSKQFTGKWSKASYDAPTRRWYFDTRFRKTPAPGTFIATTKQRAAWVRGTNTL